MRTFRAGPLLVRATGGDDRDGGGDGPAIVLCHGFGAPGDDLVALARVIDAGPGVRWFFPEAPGEVDLGFGQRGRMWWFIDMARIQLSLMSGRPREFPTDATPDGLESAREALDACIEALVRDERVDPAKLVIGGFSQGAMLTTDLAVARKRPYAGLAILSGALVAEPTWKSALATSGPSLKVFQSHGREDPLLPYPVAEKLRALLVDAGAQHEFHPFRGQHEIPAGVVEALGAFARRVLA
jgi:phospholipase/carboxylesterase